MTLLAYLVDFACVEAVRNAHADATPPEDDSDPRRNGNQVPEPRNNKRPIKVPGPPRPDGRALRPWA